MEANYRDYPLRLPTSRTTYFEMISHVLTSNSIARDWAGAFGLTQENLTEQITLAMDEELTGTKIASVRTRLQCLYVIAGGIINNDPFINKYEVDGYRAEVAYVQTGISGALPGIGFEFASRAYDLYCKTDVFMLIDQKRALAIDLTISYVGFTEKSNFNRRFFTPLNNRGEGTDRLIPRVIIRIPRGNLKKRKVSLQNYDLWGDLIAEISQWYGTARFMHSQVEPHIPNFIRLVTYVENHLPNSSIPIKFHKGIESKILALRELLPMPVEPLDVQPAD